MKSNTVIKRLLSVVTAAAFLLSSVFPQNAFSALETGLANDVKILNLIRTAVPRNAGYITDANIVSSSDNVLVYIQDMHCNPFVQKNISAIISSLDKSLNVGKVILEGVPEGKVESNALTALPEKVKYGVVEKLLGNGLVNGVELYSIDSAKDNIYGVEDWDIYVENLQRAADLLRVSRNAVNSVKPFQKDALKKTKKTLDILGDLASFKRDDRWYDKLFTAEIEYSEPLYKYSNLAGYVNMRQLSGRLDLNKVRKELGSYNQYLKEELYYRDYSNIASKIDNRVEYYEALYNNAESSDLAVFIEKYPNLYLFLTYSIKSSSINPMLVFYDEETYVNKILNSETNDYAKFEDLLIFRMTSLLNSYLSLSMTDSEFEYFSGNLELYKSFILKKHPEYADLLFTFLNNPQYGKYYLANRERNGVFLNNLTKEISGSGKVNVFVSGGFHTSVIEDFKEKGISYVLVTPAVLGNFNSVEVYNRLIELNSSAPRILSNALNPIPFMLAAFPNMPQQSRQAYVSELINTIVSSSADNYRDPLQLKEIIDEWIRNIGGLKDGDISVSYDNDVFKVKVLEQALEFKIENGLIDFKESELFVPKTEKYSPVKTALAEAEYRFSAFSPDAADYAQYAAIRIVNKATYMGMKVSGGFYSRISQRKENNWAFRFMRFFRLMKMNKAARDIVSIIAWHNLNSSKALYPARQAALDIDGRRINVVIEGTVEITDEELLEVIENARNLPRGRAPIENIPETLFIGLVDKSSHLFENYTGAGFIGVNRALYSPSALAENNGVYAKEMRKILLKIGLAHEISHEFFGRNAGGKEIESFENLRLMQDIAHIFKEFKKFYPLEAISSDDDFSEHQYNEKLKEYIMPYLEDILGGSRFLKRLAGYKLTLDELIELMKEKELSDMDIVHLEESYLTIQSDKSDWRKANDEKFFRGMVLKEIKQKNITDLNFPNAETRISELVNKLKDILRSTGEYGEDAIEKMSGLFHRDFVLGINILYKTFPDHLFERFLNDKTMVREHGISHSFDVMSYMLDILSRDKDRLKDLSERNIRLMVYSVLFHDISTVISRGNHEHNSTVVIEEMFKAYKDRIMDEAAVKELTSICAGHKKIENDLNRRPEHSNYLACLLHDADALSAVLELDRIFSVWAEISNSVFFKKHLTVKERINLLRENNYLDGDAVNDLIRQGFFRRKANLYLTEGAKAIITSSLNDNILQDYFESKRAELENIHGGIYGKDDIDLMISAAGEVIKELDNVLPQKSSDFEDKVSAFTFKNRLYLLWQTIKDFFKSKNVNFPKNVFISDIHGGYNRLVAVLSNVLNVELTPENAKEKIEEALINSDINAIYIGGDLVDRGAAALDVIDLLANAAKSGKIRFVEGNHDALVRMNLMGVHLPFYKSYKGVDAGYEDMYGNVKDLLISKINEDEEAIESGGIGTPRKERNNATDKHVWAEKFSEYMSYSKERQGRIWNAKYDDMSKLFEKAYNEKLDHKKGKDVLNNPRRMFNDDKLRKWWGMILGRNVGVVVYTGLRAVDQMSINWWKIKREELSELRKEYGEAGDEKEAFDKMEEIIDEIINNQTAKMKEEVEVNGNWMWRVIDGIMARNYESVEWWANDWGFHSAWGGGKDGLIAQRNIEIERDFRASIGVSAQAELTDEQKTRLGKMLLNNANYLNDNRMQSIGEFFKNNFFFYRRDEYGTYMMHSMLPVDDYGNVSIGRVVNGKIEKYESSGERIKGFYYKGKHYHKNSLFKGFEIIHNDIQNFDGKSGDLGYINEAITLLYSVYSDLTTEVKPADIRNKHQKIGFGNVLARMGKGVMRLTVGHNPISKSESIGLHAVEFDGTVFPRIIISGDDEFSEKYAEPMGKGGANIYSGDIGIAYVGFESGAPDAKIVGKTHVSRTQFRRSMLYDIFKPLAVLAVYTYEFLDTAFYNITDYIINRLYKRISGWDAGNTLLIDVINEAGSYGRQHGRMKDLVKNKANAVGIELKNMDLIAESERHLLKRTITVSVVNGEPIEIPISFFHKKVKDNRKSSDYVDIYIGHEAKKIIKDSGNNFEEIKDNILFAAASAFVEEIKKPNNPFERYIHPVNVNRKILMRTQSLRNFDAALNDGQKRAMEGVLIAHEGTPDFDLKENVTQKLSSLINTGGYDNLNLSGYYIVKPFKGGFVIENAVNEPGNDTKTVLDILSAA